MLRLVAIVWGVFFIMIGVAAFLPQYISNNLLFGYFEVQNLHAMIWLLTGIIAIMSATRYSRTRLFFKVIGLFYTAIAIIAFWRSGNLYLVHVNFPDTLFHLLVGVIGLYLGFMAANKTTRV